MLCIPLLKKIIYLCTLKTYYGTNFIMVYWKGIQEIG